MASEKKVTKFVEELGYKPMENGAIIVKYLPMGNLSSKIVNFFSSEIYVLQVCEKEVIMLPFHQLTGMLQKKSSLVLEIEDIEQVTVEEQLLNYNIHIVYQGETISLTTQQAELSEIRSSIYYGAFHKDNLEDVLKILKGFGKQID